MSTGLSVQAQDSYPLKTSIDQRGDQTINHDAMTSGGISSFANSSSSILKWCLNRSDAAKAVGALHEMTELENSSTLCKELTSNPDSQIRGKCVKDSKSASE